MAVCWAVELVAQKAGLFEGHSQIDPIFVRCVHMQTRGWLGWVGLGWVGGWFDAAVCIRGLTD